MCNLLVYGNFLKKLTYCNHSVCYIFALTSSLKQNNLFFKYVIINHDENHCLQNHVSNIMLEWEIFSLQWK